MKKWDNNSKIIYITDECSIDINHSKHPNVNDYDLVVWVIDNKITKLDINGIISKILVKEVWCYESQDQENFYY